MLVDLLASDNMGSYNVKIAKIMGLHTAVYINELMNISNKASEKNKLVDGKHFILDRKYITKRTTIEEQEQLAIDSKLISVGVINKPDGGIDLMNINIEQLASLIINDDVKKLTELSSKTRVKTVALPGMKQTLRLKLADEMKSYITTTNDELKVAFSDWVDAVLANPKSSGLTKTKVQIFQRDVHAFANQDLDVALKVVEIATISGYVDAHWAIKRFNSEYSTQFKKRVEESGIKKRSVSVGEEVF